MLMLILLVDEIVNPPTMPILLGLEQVLSSYTGQANYKLQHVADIGHRKGTKSFLQSTRIGTSSLIYIYIYIFTSGLFFLENFGLSFPGKFFFYFWVIFPMWFILSTTSLDVSHFIIQSDVTRE